MPETKSPPPERRVSHISHSSRETLLRCAKSYFLSRIAGAPKRPALWLAGGSAVHMATEEYDRLAVMGEEERFDVEARWQLYFQAELATARRSEPNENRWRRSSTEPVDVWNQLGPQFIRSYIDWRQRSPWQIWTTPDGQPAIELDVSGYLPGCPVEIKAYTDRLFWDPVFEHLEVVDLKTGKRPPKTADQFGTYAALIEAKYGVTVHSGIPFMNRKGTVGRPFDLEEYTPEAVGQLYGEAWKQIERGEFPADGYDSECFICDVSDACFVKNGPLAHIYDPDHPNHPDHKKAAA
ncbi:PD-(D/E)XK nuclease family protein [Streptomyces sp. CY1]|uniref:PD-(D/E)XK nuclease family protein n=1 Tax=Streptomyces sp. CY1 TaxID=3388313 RepID=UPI0039A262F8